jgi:hypothetical protein
MAAAFERMCSAGVGSSKGGLWEAFNRAAIVIRISFAAASRAASRAANRTAALPPREPSVATTIFIPPSPFARGEEILVLRAIGRV